MRYHTIATGIGGRILTAAAPQLDPKIPNSDAEKGLKREWAFLSVCCAIAAVRLLAFIAAFPFFNSTDEASHFDTIIRYASGDIPRELSMYSPRAAYMIALYISPEYLDLPSVRFMPRDGTVSSDEFAQSLKRLTFVWTRSVSHESTSPPIYYLLAGAWHNLGAYFSIEGKSLLYWTRLLNIPTYILIVIVAYLLTKELFPTSQSLKLGVPLMLAFFPQDVFYGLNDGPMAALASVFALYLIVRLHQAKAPSLALMIGAGLATAAAFLTKYWSLPVLTILLFVIWRKQQPIFSFSLRQPLARAAWLPLLTAAVPILIWSLRNYADYGEPTGVAERNRYMGWTAKPIAQWWDHPIYSLHGLAGFFSTLTKTFWRGEYDWHFQSMGTPAMDRIYVGTSALFFACFIVRICMTRRQGPITPVRFAAPFCLLVIAMSVGFLIYLSISIDFGDCFYPSRNWPFFSSGRLALASLVPFLIIYLSGLDALLGWLRLKFAYPYVLGLLAITMTVSEVLVSREVFASPYNWFHLH